MKSARYGLCVLSLLCAVTLASCGGHADDGKPATDPSTVTTEAPLPESLPATSPETEGTTDTTADRETDTTPDTTPTTEPDAPETLPAPVIPADALDVTAHGVTADAGHAMENSLALVTLFDSLPDGATVYFPEGTYELAFPMFLIGKQNIRLVGDHATLLRTGMNNTAPQMPPVENSAIPAAYQALTYSSAFLATTDAKGITVEGLTFGYDTPTSLSGKVVSVEGGSAVIELTDGSTVTGGEYATVINTFTADGVPDRVLEHYAETSFSVEKLDEKTIRVSGIDPGGASRLRSGTRVCVRLCTGRDYIIIALRATDLIFRDLTFCNSFNGGIILAERCGNATLDHVRVRSDNPEALMSLNADVLHIADMTGKLTVQNCRFDRSGDDGVNVHSSAYVVDAVEGSKVTLSSPRMENSPVWAIAGDTLAFYDPVTFAVVATAKVTAVDGKSYTLDSTVGIAKGCVTANTATRPEVIIRHTTVSNTRARGFLLQTDRATVENCHFKNTALAAILIASDVDHWYEMSPMRELTVRNNTFENCGHHAAGVIQITASHDNPDKTYQAKIHGKIEILSNRFMGIRTPAIYALCTETLTVRKNDITATGYRDAYLWVKSCGTVTASQLDPDRIEADNVDKLTTE